MMTKKNSYPELIITTESCHFKFPGKILCLRFTSKQKLNHLNWTQLTNVITHNSTKLIMQVNQQICQMLNFTPIRWITCSVIGFVANQ